MMKKMLLMLFCTVALFGAFFGLKLFMNDQMAKGMAGYVPPPTVIEPATANSETWYPYLSSIGTLSARQGVDIRSEVAGVISKVHFESGQEISESALLAQLDDDTERANLKSFQARQKLAKLTWTRDKSLIERKAISQTEFDQASANLDEATAAVEQTRATLRKKKITAPFSGRIGIRQAEPGDYLKEGDILATLQNINQLYVDFAMPEQDYPDLYIGQSVRFSVQAYPDKEFDAVVDAINAKINSNTRNIEVRAMMDNSMGELVPGMFADIKVMAEKPKSVITLPRTAITYSLYGDSVYLITGDKPENLTVKLTQVTTGDIQGNRVEIVSGLQANDRVAASGQLKLRNGARVTIKSAGE
ncbi:efflux RND transporter periplasmic adaptor subunit [Parendozoicomonas sp. Alg238-R29]|uniref:efflux RND transporter periplasmic adaptor subunit n=1 Tax=Parendozoicomonas sp. Alg238-R29 TaxID=2993446 RepID=UPI00248D7E57|nr:efflux RND transporter periplasmic adaptor subunit [Parendozoicomonas sp. Alg238-R29]